MHATLESSVPAGTSLGGRRDLAAAAVIAVVATLLPFHRGLVFPFALDDYTFLLQAAGLDPSPFSLRRWLAVSGYYSLWLRLFGPNPLAWHVTSFVLHAANAVWVYAFARRLGASRDGSWIACGLFAASPLAFTTLYWAACIQEIGSTFFLFAAVWVGWRADRWRWTAVGLFALAMLCKESVIAAPLVLPLVIGRRARGPALAMLAAGAALFIGAGLQQRMFDASLDSPYATSYGWTLIVNLATQFVWFVAPWRAYPDRVAGPQPALVLPAAAVAGAIAVALVTTRGRYARMFVAACAWFVALLLPVLPLRQHSYAYYSYAPQVGFLILFGAGLSRLVARLAPGSWWWRSGAGTAVVAASVLLAGHNTRVHESLKLQNSIVPHDSVVRYGSAAGAIVAALHESPITPDVRQVAFMNFPEELGRAARTPGQERPGMVRVRKLPLRDALRGGKLVTLNLPGVNGVWIDTLNATFEGPDTVIFFTSGFNTLERVPGAAEAYVLQAQGRLLVGDGAGARRDLERALALAPEFGGARLLLAGVEVETGNLDRARELLRGLAPGSIPEDLRGYYVQLERALGMTGDVPPHRGQRTDTPAGTGPQPSP